MPDPTAEELGRAFDAGQQAQIESQGLRPPAAKGYHWNVVSGQTDR